jgi:hypothetical protein
MFYYVSYGGGRSGTTLCVPARFWVTPAHVLAAGHKSSYNRFLSYGTMLSHSAALDRATTATTGSEALRL